MSKNVQKTAELLNQALNALSDDSNLASSSTGACMFDSGNTSQDSRLEAQQNFRNSPNQAGSSSRQQRVEANFRAAFPALSGGGYRNTSRKRKYQSSVMFKPRETWTHNFILLSSPDDSATPTNAMLQKLKDASLGRKKVVFENTNGDWAHTRATLEDTFPEMETLHGAFELLRLDKGGTNQSLNMITIPGDGREVCPSSVIYIRPIQEKLSMKKTNYLVTAVEKKICIHCSNLISLVELRRHTQECRPSSSILNTSRSMTSENKRNGSDEILIDDLDDLPTVFPVKKSDDEVKNLQNLAYELLDNSDAADPKFKSLDEAIDYLQKYLSDETAKIKVDEEDVLCDMMAYFKGSEFKPATKLKIRLNQQPAVDTGGVLRHAFTKCFEQMLEGGGGFPPFLKD